MASFKQPLRSLALASSFVFASTVVSGPGSARADVPGIDPKAAAAAAFDAGVAAYKAGDYRNATDQFLRADAAQPNVSALANALASARLSEDPALLANVAARCLSRENVPAEVVNESRAALADVAPRVSELVVRCEAEPCEPLVDGEHWPPEARYVVPGAHQVTAREPGFVGQEVSCAAGQGCSVSLQLARPEPPPPPPPAPPVDAPPRYRHLPLGVFVASGVAALTLAAVGTYTGVQAIHEKDKYTSDPENYDRDRTKSLALTTDFLFVGSVLCAGAAVATGVWWVDWKDYGKSRVVASPRGDLLWVHRVAF